MDEELFKQKYLESLDQLMDSGYATDEELSSLSAEKENISHKETSFDKLDKSIQEKLLAGEEDPYKYLGGKGTEGTVKYELDDDRWNEAIEAFNSKNKENGNMNTEGSFKELVDSAAAFVDSDTFENYSFWRKRLLDDKSMTEDEKKEEFIKQVFGNVSSSATSDIPVKNFNSKDKAASTAAKESL